MQPENKYKSTHQSPGEKQTNEKQNQTKTIENAPISFRPEHNASVRSLPGYLYKLQGTPLGFKLSVTCSFPPLDLNVFPRGITKNVRWGGEESGKKIPLYIKLLLLLVYFLQAGTKLFFRFSAVLVFQGRINGQNIIKTRQTSRSIKRQFGQPRRKREPLDIRIRISIRIPRPSHSPLLQKHSHWVSHSLARRQATAIA